METAKAQENLAEVHFVDPIDEINHLVAYLDFISEMWPGREGESLQLSPRGADGFCLLLMNIGERLQKANNTLYETLKDLSARAERLETPEKI
jgi:hypothetical protein